MRRPLKSKDAAGGIIIDIVQVIEEMESLASSATRVPGFRKRVMVDSDRLETIVSELRVSIPSDMQEAREILTQKDSVINQAHLEARRVKESAEHEALALTASAKEEQATRIDDAELPGALGWAIDQHVVGGEVAGVQSPGQGAFQF